MQRVCMTVLLMVSCWFDIRYSKIPNPLILTGWIVGLALTGWQQGLKGMAWSIAGILVIMAAGFPLYWCKAIGAGDVKLLSVLAGIHGVKRSVLVFAVGIPLAAAAGLFVLAGSALGMGQWIPARWKRSLPARREVFREAEGRRLGGHRLILAPFLTLAYFFV